MKTEIDIIVEDLCACDTELSKDAVLVRHIVAHLLENRPQVEVDDVFRSNLRQELLLSMAAQKNAKATPSPWWLLYIAPVGVTAVLLVLLQPSLTEAPHDLYESPAIQLESSLKMDDGVGRAASSNLAPAADMANGYVGGNTDLFTVSTAADRSSFVLDYISISQPGFVVVTSPEGERVGISAPLESGEQTGIVVPAITSLQEGVIYTARLYYDNGDGVYREDEEVLALDENGNPLTTVTTVTN